MFEMIEETKYLTSAGTMLVFAVDDDDPKLRQYEKVYEKCGHGMTDLVVGPPLRMVPTLNSVALDRVAHSDFIGFMGDDHHPRTQHWDRIIVENLQRKGGVVYCDDLWQRENLATAVFMDADIIEILGYMAPERLIHMYADNFWMALGTATRRTYLPNVVIEHMHPDAGKGSRDEVYDSTNNPTVYTHDRVEYERYVREDWPRERERLQQELRYPEPQKMVRR